MGHCCESASQTNQLEIGSKIDLDPGFIRPEKKKLVKKKSSQRNIQIFAVNELTLASDMESHGPKEEFFEVLDTDDLREGNICNDI